MRRHYRPLALLLGIALALALGYIASIRETFSEINVLTREIRTRTRQAFIFESEWKYGNDSPRRAARREQRTDDKSHWKRFSHVTKGLLHTSRACSLLDPVPEVSSGITGRWVMPQAMFMAIEVSLRSDGTFEQFFYSDMAGSSGISTGDYSFDKESGTLFYGHSTYRRASANGVELLIRDDSWKDWEEKRAIYVTLIKTSDDPHQKAASIQPGDPILERLYSNGVTEK
jgi:hypothetical protein